MPTFSADDITVLVGEFNQFYANIETEVNVENAKKVFQIFWTKIMDQTTGKLDHLRDMDPFIRFLDKTARRRYYYKTEEERENLREALKRAGEQYGLDYDIIDQEAKNRLQVEEHHFSTAKTMVQQNEWYKMFHDLKQHAELRKKLNDVFDEKDLDEKVRLVDELRELNRSHKNFLTKDNANALNAILFCSDPSQYTCVVSLSDRRRIVAAFDLGEYPDTGSYGLHVIRSNEHLKNFNKKYSANLSPRALSRFFYYERVRPLWKAQNDSTTSNYERARHTQDQTLGRIANVDFNTFLRDVGHEKLTRTKLQSLSNPEMVKINRVIENCDKLSWVIPNFQRYFTWKRNDVREFLASVLKDYYVGALLLWNSGGKLPLDVTPIRGVEPAKKDLQRSSIILDGQQRITSLYYAIKAPNFPLRGSSQPLYFYINFANLLQDEEEASEVVEVLQTRLDRQETFKKMIFPFYELENYVEWVDEFEDFMQEQSNGDYDVAKHVRRFIDRKLAHMYDGFQIPYIELPNTMSLGQVTEIFEKINTTGRALNVFDLVIARLTLYKIPMRPIWEDTLAKFAKIHEYFTKYHFEDIPINILQAILLSYTKAGHCKRENILDIYEKVFESDHRVFDKTWFDMASYVERAIHKLENLRSDGFGVRSKAEMPFATMIPAIASLLKDIDSRDEQSSYFTKLGMWYWAAVFSEVFSGSADTQLPLEFNAVKAWFSDDEAIPKTVQEFRKFVSNLDLMDIRMQGNAKYRGVLSLVALRGAKDFVTDQTLENARGNDKDHLFPKLTYHDEKNVDSILNMTWMSRDTNQRVKGAKRPKEYLADFVGKKGERQFLETLETHLINRAAYECMLKNDFQGFLAERQKMILEEIGKKIGLTSLPPPQQASSLATQETIDELIRKGESEDLEFKSALTWDYKQGSQNREIERAVTKTICAFMNSKGGTLVIGVDDQGHILGLEKDFSILSKPNKDGLQQKLTGLVNSMLGKEKGAHVHLSWRKCDNNDVALIKVDRGQSPTYLNTNPPEFYIRTGSSSQPLNVQEANEYIRDHWS